MTSSFILLIGILSITKRCFPSAFGWNSFEEADFINIRHATKDDGQALSAIEAASYPAAEGASAESIRGRLAHYPDHFWLLPFYAKFGFVDEGVSASVHGNVVWHQMRLTLQG